MANSSHDPPHFSASESFFSSRYEIQVGATFAKYQIVQKLAEGGMGTVYLAQDQELGRTVALKVISLHGISEVRIKRFLQEAKATARLRHPNIISVFEVGSSPQHYFTMEYLPGPLVSDLLKQAPLAVSQAVKIALQIAQALYYAHSKGIIHRDIKPSNIMLDENENPKLMDFGLSKMQDTQVSFSKVGETLGTPVYMSPEQAKGKNIDQKSDVYSLGATLYEMITGQPLFQGDSYFIILNQVFHTPPVPPRTLLPSIPKDLEAIILRSLAKNPKHRYQSARSFARDLKNFLEKKQIMARKTPHHVLFQQFLREYQWWLTVLFLVLAIMLSTFLGYQWGESQALSFLGQQRVVKEESAGNTKKVLPKEMFDTLREYFSGEETRKKNLALLENSNFFIRKSLAQTLASRNLVELKICLELHASILERIKDRDLLAANKELYDQVLRAFPELGVANYVRGYLDFSLGNGKQALVYFHKVGKESGKELLALQRMAQVYLQLQQAQNALKTIQKAIRLSPQNAWSYVLRAKVLLQKKKISLALKDVQQALQLDPECLQAHKMQGVLWLEQQRYQEAYQAFTHALFLNPLDPSLHVLRARVYEAQQRPAVAENSLTQAILLHPKNSHYYFLRGKLRAKLDNREGAIWDWQQALRLGSPHREKIYQLLSSVHSSE